MHLKIRILPLKSILLLLTVLMLFSGNSYGKLNELPFNLVIENILPDTYVVTDKSYFNSNTLVTKMTDGTVVIASSPFENLGTKTLINWIKKDLRPTQIIAINTHFHSDGTGGNQIFNQNNVQTWSSHLTKRLQISQSKKLRQETIKFYKSPDLKNRVLKTKITPANHLFTIEEGKVFNFGDETIEVYFPGHAHSPDNVVVYFHKRKLLFGGCMIKPNKSLGYLRDANVVNWIKAAKNLLKFDAKIVVPGHSKWGTKDLIYKTIKIAKNTLTDQMN